MTLSHDDNDPINIRARFEGQQKANDAIGNGNLMARLMQ